MKISEIANDCYLMAEAISGKTDPEEITDFAYCIYVVFSHLVEIEHDKRIEIAKFFQEEIHRYAREIQQGREVAHKEGKEETGGWVDIEPQMPSVASLPTEEENPDEFLKQLDEDIGSIPGTMSDLNLELKSTAKKAITLEPVIKKLAPGGMMSATSSPRAEPVFPRDTEGSKSNPIKLTKEMLSGIISEKDLAKVEKGIKVKRVQIGTKYQSIHETTLANVRSVTVDKYPDSKSIEQQETVSLEPQIPQNKLEFELFQAVQEIKEKPGAETIIEGGLDFGDSLSGPMLDLGSETEEHPEHIRRDLSVNKICKNCKSLNPDDSKFCYRCGTPL
ncbi:MAG: zinc ribbon domain-containing protein [Candidatus Hodarchaeota archaeon]